MGLVSTFLFIFSGTISIPVLPALLFAYQSYSSSIVFVVFVAVFCASAIQYLVLLVWRSRILRTTF